MALIDALGVFAILVAWRANAWHILIPLVLLLIAANVIYFAKRMLPGKYIFPGLAFLLVFQIFIVGYTVYVSFTNFGDGHNSTKDQAIQAILMQNEHRVEGTNAYPIAVVQRGSDLGFAIVAQDGSCPGATNGVGTATQPLQVVDGTADANGRPSEVAGYTVLSMREIVNNQQEVLGLRVPVSDNANDGSIRTANGTTAFAFKPTMVYDPHADTMTDVVNNVVYHPNHTGQFQAADGSVLATGWRVPVGFVNYTQAFGDPRFRGPFLEILVWNIAFAFLSVATTFLFGLFLAIVFNDDRFKARRVYRTLLILPYAIPGFLAALIWRGLLNSSFGFINQVLLNGATIPWLSTPWLARLSILFVNLWLGFPYMFLITTGALQSLPDDINEAARVDGAGRWRMFRSITMPLLLVSTAPLLISSFAFNFNNFTLIYMLTGGGAKNGQCLRTHRPHRHFDLDGIHGVRSGWVR